MTIWANTKLCKKYFVMTVAANMLTNAMDEKNKVYSNRTDNNILSSWKKKKKCSVHLKLRQMKHMSQVL